MIEFVVFNLISTKGHAQLTLKVLIDCLPRKSNTN